MTLKNFLNYCKYSGVWVSFAVNPYHWRFSFELEDPTDMDPKIYAVYISVGPLSIRAILDDGTW